MMADLTLRHPANGANQVIPSEKFDHIAFDFPSDSVVLSKEGNDLLLSFEDGSRITLTDFYTTFSKDSIPDFIVDGTSVSGSEFFAALNEPDLMPAAGPAVAASNADGGRFHEYTDASLMDGVERLGGLDLGLNRAAEPDRELEAYGNRGVEEEETVVEEVIVPERPLFNDAPSGGSSVVTTDEGNIPGMGSQHETSVTQPFGAATDGSFKMELHGADATVTIGGTELKVENGKLYHNGVEVTADAAVSVPGGAHGTLTVTGMDADGTVHYTYTLTAPVDATGNASNRPGEGDAGRGEAVHADAFDVTITTTGGTATGQITVDALDDAPVLTVQGDRVEHAADSASGSITDTFMVHFGADGPGDAAFTFDGHTLVKNDEGSWQYTDPDGLYTITVVQTGTDANEFRYSYTLEYDSTKVKEGFGGDLKVVATDGDLDTATDTVHIAVTNTAPEAADNIYDIDKAVAGESIISASASAVLGDSIITVGGTVGDRIHTGWMTDKQDDAFSVLEDGVAGDLFGKFFSDLGGNNLTLDTLKDAAHIYTLKISSGTSADQVQAAVKYASEHNLLL